MKTIWVNGWKDVPQTLTYADSRLLIQTDWHAFVRKKPLFPFSIFYYCLVAGIFIYGIVFEYHAFTSGETRLWFFCLIELVFLWGIVYFLTYDIWCTKTTVYTISGEGIDIRICWLFERHVDWNELSYVGKVNTTYRAIYSSRAVAFSKVPLRALPREDVCSRDIDSDDLDLKQTKIFLNIADEQQDEVMRFVEPFLTPEQMTFPGRPLEKKRRRQKPGK